MIRDREATIRWPHVPQNDMAAPLMVSFVADLLEHLDDFPP